MNLADLVDLEWLLAEPARLPDAVVHTARPAAHAAAAQRGLDPAAAAGRIDVDRELRERLCEAVLVPARAADPTLPGRHVERAIGVVAFVLVGSGLLCGASTALAVLAYDGTTPVNVLHFVLVFVVLQVVLLALLVWFLLRARRGAAAGAGPALPHRAVAWLVDRALGKRGRAAAEVLRLLRARHALYADVERWTLFALVQRFGVAFNVAALVVTLLLLTGTDLVFAWSTTLLTPVDVHAWTTVLALPWAAWDAGVPSFATIEASQWVRMSHSFVQENDAAARVLYDAVWWRFLVAGLVVYGLVPRTLALWLGRWRARAALRSAGLDHGGFHVLYERLLPRGAGFVGPDPASVRGAPPIAAGPGPATPHAPAQPGASVVVLCWGSLARAADTVRTAASARWQLQVAGTFAVGGASLAADERALHELASLAPRRALVAFAAGQQPTADALAFLRAVRQHLGPAKPLVVLLANPGEGGDAEAEEHSIWRRSLGTLGDVHLWLETLEGAR